jgi:anti-anti-sigma factor
MANRSVFQGQIEAALAQNVFLALDLSRVTFMDSAAFGVLVALTKQARTSGGDLSLLNLQAPVRRSIELLRLDRFLTLGGKSTGLVAQARDSTQPSANSIDPVNCTDPIGPWAVYSLPSRLDAAHAPEVCARLETQLAANAHMIVDFSATVFLDSSGIATLLRLHRLAQKTAGELRLAHLERDVRRSLELAGMDKVFHLYESTISAARTPIITASDEAGKDYHRSTL